MSLKSCLVSSVWRRTASDYKDIEIRIKVLDSRLLYKTLLNHESGWVFMVNACGGSASNRKRGLCCEKKVIWLIN